MSRDRKEKVYDILDKVNKFLLGDTVEDVFTAGDEQLRSAFSKEENDRI